MPSVLLHSYGLPPPPGRMLLMASQTTFGSPLDIQVLITLLAFLPPADANTSFTEEPGSYQIIGDVDVYGTSPLSTIFH
jgi:hypothetical protein